MGGCSKCKGGGGERHLDWLVFYRFPLSSSCKSPFPLPHAFSPRLTLRSGLRLLEDSGCALLAVHGRKLLCTKSKHRDGPADLGAIAAVRAALRIPVLSNGNVRCPGDVAGSLIWGGGKGRKRVLENRGGGGGVLKNVDAKWVRFVKAGPNWVGTFFGVSVVYEAKGVHNFMRNSQLDDQSLTWNPPVRVPEGESWRVALYF